MRKKGSALLLIISIFSILIIFSLVLFTYTYNYINSTNVSYNQKQAYLNSKTVLDEVNNIFINDPNKLLELEDDGFCDLYDDYTFDAKLDEMIVKVNMHCEKNDDLKRIIIDASNVYDGIEMHAKSSFIKKDELKNENEYIIDYLKKYDSFFEDTPIDYNTAIYLTMYNMRINDLNDLIESLVSSLINTDFRNSTINGNLLVDQRIFIKPRIGFEKTTVNGSLILFDNTEIYVHSSPNVVNKVNGDYKILYCISNNRCSTRKSNGVSFEIMNSNKIYSGDNEIKISGFNIKDFEKNVNETNKNEDFCKLENSNDINPICSLLYRSNDQTNTSIEDLMADYKNFDEINKYQALPRIINLKSSSLNRFDFDLEEFSGLIYAPNTYMVIDTSKHAVTINGKIVCKGIFVNGKHEFIVNNINYGYKSQNFYQFENYLK